jgi:competence ComEA-like helix-hairpin-helix protein
LKALTTGLAFPTSTADDKPKKGDKAMKNIKYIVAMAVFLIGIGFSVYASDEGITDISSGALNINTATVQELSMLPFVDSRTAQDIVNFRDSHGPFTAIDELKNVKGITRPLLEDLSSHLKLEGSSDFNPYGVL